MNKTFKIVLMVCAIVLVIAISGSMIYYFAFAKPGHERAELEWEKEKQAEEDRKETAKQKEEVFKKAEIEAEQTANEEALLECLNTAINYQTESLEDAYDFYRNRLDVALKNNLDSWNAECKRLGFENDCALPQNIANNVTEVYESEVKRADEAYKSSVERIDKIFENSKEDCYKLYGSD